MHPIANRRQHSRAKTADADAASKPKSYLRVFAKPPRLRIVETDGGAWQVLDGNKLLGEFPSESAAEQKIREMIDRANGRSHDDSTESAESA